MTYHGIKLLLAGYLADEGHLLKQVGAMLDSLEPRFPHGSLWLLNRAKLARYENNPSLAIEILQRGLGPERSVKFQQADALLMFELAWVLLAERRYQEAADAFLTMKRLNTWSHPTYTFLAAGCYLALKTDQARTKAQELFDTLPTLLQKKKVGGKDLPTEVYIMKKLDFWRRKQTRWFGPERSDMFVECIRINPAEELGVFWNTHGRIPKTTAEAHIREFLALTPPVNVASPYAVELDTSLATANSSNTNDTLNQNPIADLDSTDELNFQHLILGITHRGVGEFAAARAFLEYATRNAKSLEGKWIIPLAYFELAVLDLHEARAHELKVQSRGNDRPVDDELKSLWKKAIQSATSHVEESQANLGDTDLSSRLDARLAMIRDEIEHKSKITIH
ncbi:hypothetical protein FRC02_003958 [Tulasnella sp. 418]|nr:hypothetical protein FRC02_003958 [Tulasnella sp. 418]